MRIVVAGSGRLGASVLEPLLDSSHDVVAIVQNGRTIKGWRRLYHRVIAALPPMLPEPMRIASRKRIPILWLDAMDEPGLARLRALKPDLFITCGFGIILKKPLLDLPAIGCVNVHSSFLPRHRGPNPFSYAILDGDTESGVTFHITAEGIDTGDIVAQYPFPIEPTDTALNVYYKSCDLAKARTVSVVDKIEAEGLWGTPQDEALATYDPKMTLADLAVRWDDTAEQIDRVVRAGISFGFAQFRHRFSIVRILAATPDPTPVDAPPGTVLKAERPVHVATGKGTLAIDRAFTALPAPWPWPSGLNKPAVGEQLPIDDSPDDEPLDDDSG